ncbi:MAG: hypothetical protein RL095_480 [Verrucomicrobiota bacterium]|jgi:hypothetical protein
MLKKKILAVLSLCGLAVSASAAPDPVMGAIIGVDQTTGAVSINSGEMLAQGAVIIGGVVTLAATFWLIAWAWKKIKQFVH